MRDSETARHRSHNRSRHRLLLFSMWWNLVLRRKVPPDPLPRPLGWRYRVSDVRRVVGRMRRKLSGRRFATRITDRISPPPAAGTVAALALPEASAPQGRYDAPGYDAAASAPERHQARATPANVGGASLPRVLPVDTHQTRVTEPPPPQPQAAGLWNGSSPGSQAPAWVPMVSEALLRNRCEAGASQTGRSTPPHAIAPLVLVVVLDFLSGLLFSSFWGDLS